MPLCEQCQSISDRTTSTRRHIISHHDAASLAKAVEKKCFACVRIWESLSEEQQAIARHVDFEGLDCVLFLNVQSSARVDNLILGHLTFEHGEDLYCDDYNEIGGWRGPAGHFAILNPDGTRIQPGDDIDDGCRRCSCGRDKIYAPDRPANS